MLHALFGSRNLERILLFLFVNEKCYATQLQTLLQVPLTPIQNGLERLKKGGVITSYFEGKARMYQFNSSYPLLQELETMLRKAYALLPAQEKKRYCFIHKQRLSYADESARDQNARKEIAGFWERLAKTQTLLFSAKSKQGEQKTLQNGKAEVIVSAGPSSVIFQEKGVWLVDELPGSAFSNSFRWTLNLSQSLISLEHLRYGPTRPVFLFHLAPTRPGVLESVDSHLCAEDTYLGNIIWTPKAIQFHWRIIGPRKNDELIYRYY
jgi:hypothetical protein